ncbi:MAG TPA: 1-acylglycerol-3-phosphate O-acyltransferase [Candidatus Methylomirabilis sp.]|nr:1-acylglycerol-3-phosphate O-acyltransferase [Candidatus Methylomirabilis sp.]
MATPATQLDASAVRDRVLELIRGLLEELGSRGALPVLSPSSHLDRDLGLGSLERVELLARLEAAFNVRLPDRLVSEANTPQDLVQALRLAPGLSADDEVDSAVRTSVTVQKLQREAADEGIFQAETLLDVMRYRAIHDAERTHLMITEDSDGGERRVGLTFAELYSAAQRCAAELARRGVPAGGRIALMLPTSRAFFVSYAGILMAGAVPVPIYPPFRADRIEEYAARQSAILSNAEVCLLLTFRQAEAVARLLKPRVRTLKDVVDAEKLIDAADKAPPPSPGALPLHLSGSRVRKASDIALLQYTSGSTGNPKGVVLTHANLLANMRAIGEVVELGPEDVAVTWLPLYHDMGLIGAWLTLLHFGASVAVMSPMAFLTRPERWLKAFHKYRGTVAAAPNFAYELCVRKIADKDIEGVDLSSWRAALNGAEPVNPETLERFAQRFAAYGFRREAQLPVYGLAEASLAVTVPPLNRGPLEDRVEREVFAAEGRAVPARDDDSTAISFVSSGKPLPQHEVRIVDSSGQEVSDRTEGFLWFRGPSATSGYYQNARATEELFPQEQPRDSEFAWVNSGDRAYRADGEIYVTGRVKDIIIKGGRNLYPHEVEELAARADGIRKGCIVAFGLKDEASGTEKLVVVAESREREAARRAVIAASVTEQVSRGLGLPPDRVELIPPGSIPKTSSGKLRREETKQLYLAGTLADGKPPAWMQITRLAASGVARTVGGDIWAALRRGLEILYGLYFDVILGLAVVVGWAIVGFARNERQAGRFTVCVIKVLFAVGACRVRVQGKEFFDAPGAKVFVSNHVSYLDVLALMNGLGAEYHFVAKMEIGHMPFIGTFLRRMGHLTFDRSDAQSRLRQSEQLEELLRQGESVFVFPEGTFTKEEGVRPFQLGAFKAAVDAGAPVVPVSLAGTRKLLRDGTVLPRPSRVTITVSPPIYPRVSSDSANSGETSAWHELIRLRDASREAIARHSGEPLL